jgi:hypothetical protein
MIKLSSKSFLVMELYEDYFNLGKWNIWQKKFSETFEFKVACSFQVLSREIHPGQVNSSFK